MPSPLAKTCFNCIFFQLTFARFYLPAYIPEAEKAIYLDDDVIVQGEKSPEMKRFGYEMRPPFFFIFFFKTSKFFSVGSQVTFRSSMKPTSNQDMPQPSLMTVTRHLPKALFVVREIRWA